MKNKILSKVFGWMFIGLLLTFFTGYYIANHEYTFYKIFSGGIYFLFVILEVVLVIFLSARVHKMQSNAAKIVFVIYSIVTGVTFSAIFMTYNITSILVVFLAVSILFGIFALLGYYTKIDLTKVGCYLLMGLIALIICVIINLFVDNGTFGLVINWICLLVFIGFTAYDIQKIKRLFESTTNENIAIIGALELYLDFINIFISLLDILGSGKD